MKTSPSKYALFVLLVIAFGSSSIIAQINFKEPLDPYSLHKSVKKHKIKSLLIFIEMNEDDISERGSITGKLEEVTNNSQGFVTYRLRTDNRGNPPFIAYGRGCYFYEYSYDPDGYPVAVYAEDYQRTNQELRTFDQNGNQTNVTYLNGVDTVVQIGFNWGKGKMIEVELIYSN